MYDAQNALSSYILDYIICFFKCTLNAKPSALTIDFPSNVFIPDMHVATGFFPKKKACQYFLYKRCWDPKT